MRSPVPFRRLVARLPEALQPKPKRTARVIAIDDMGEIVHDISCDASTFHVVNGRPRAPRPGVARLVVRWQRRGYYFGGLTGLEGHDRRDSGLPRGIVSVGSRR